TRGNGLTGHHFGVGRRESGGKRRSGESDELARGGNGGTAGVLPWISGGICQARLEPDRLQLTRREGGRGTQREDGIRCIRCNRERSRKLEVRGGKGVRLHRLIEGQHDVRPERLLRRATGGNSRCQLRRPAVGQSEG